MSLQDSSASSEPEGLQSQGSEKFSTESLEDKTKTVETNIEEGSPVQKRNHEKDVVFIGAKDRPKMFFSKLSKSRQARVVMGFSLFLFLVFFMLLALLLMSESSQSKSNSDSFPASSPTKFPTNSAFLPVLMSLFFKHGDFSVAKEQEDSFRNLTTRILFESMQSINLEPAGGVELKNIREGSIILDYIVWMADEKVGPLFDETSIGEVVAAKLNQDQSYQAIRTILFDEDDADQSIKVVIGDHFQNTEAPTNNPTNSPSIYTSVFPTTRPTDSPTYYPTGADSTNFPTKIPTQSPVIPTNSPTQEPSPFPSTSPTHSPVVTVKNPDFSCTDEIFDVIIMNVLPDNNFGDIEHDEDGYLKPFFEDSLLPVFKHRASNFRVSHPTHELSQMGSIFGKYPHSGNLGDLRKNVNKFSIYDMLKKCGFSVAHFGLWHSDASLLQSMKLTKTFLSKDPEAVKKSVVEYMKDKNVFSKGSKQAIFIWWPKVDVYNNWGASYSAVYDTTNQKVLDVKGIESKTGAVCKDVVREENEDGLTSATGEHSQRYSVCAPQIHIANKRRELQLLSEVTAVVSEEVKSSEKYNTFIALTGSNGPEDSAADPNIAGKTKFRGFKRSLYEGGIRIPFFYNSYIKRKPVTFGDYNLNSLGEIESLVAMNAVDIVPMIMKFGGVEPNTDLSYYLDGLNLFENLKANQDDSSKVVSRGVNVFFENNVVVKERCLNDSPRFAIIDNTGRFKLLIEPNPSFTGTLPLTINENDRIELYDTEYAPYEAINWANSNIENTDLDSRIRTIQESLYTSLRKILINNQVVGAGDVHTGCGELYRNTKEKSAPAVSSKRSKELEGIIIILADDVGHSDVSIYGGIEGRNRDDSFFMADTPNIDRIAKQGGVAMTNFYSNSAVCSPSRAALLTAKYPSHIFNKIHSAIPLDKKYNNQKGTAGYLGENTERAQFNMNTFFRSNGFVTGHFGKWHLGFNGAYVDDEMYSLDQFQVYAAQPFPASKKQMAFPTSQNASKVHNTEFDNSHLLFPSKSSGMIIDRGIEFIQERINLDEKFLMNLWLQNAHAPLNIATEYDEVAYYNYSYRNNLVSSRRISTEEGKLDTSIEVYRSLVGAQDKAIGKLLDFLEASGKLESTAILYMSDNGAESMDKYFNSVGNSFSQLRGYKRSLYEGGIRVPGLFRWGGFDKAEAPKIVTKSMSSIDIFPSLVGLSGLEQELTAQLEKLASENPSYAPSSFKLQGRDLSCEFTNEECYNTASNSVSQLDDEIIVFEWRETNQGGDCLGWSARFGARYKQYKIHLEPEKVTRRQVKILSTNWQSEFSRIEIYNVEIDPAETTNLWVSQIGDQTIVETVKTVVDYLVDFTSREEYDTSLFPSSRSKNVDYTTGTFVVGQLCENVYGQKEPGELPEISSSFVETLVQ